MSDQKTFWDMSSATFSQALRVGRSLLDSQDGRDQCGPPPARASRSRAQGKDWESETRAIYGRCFDAWLAGADLQFALANRLRQRLDVNGSPECVLTWRDWDMPLGPPICALRASARRTYGSGCFGWRTPTAAEKVRSKKFAEGREVGPQELVGWSTPQTHDTRKRGNRDNPAGGGGCLALDADLVGWVSPTARDHSRGGLPPRPQDTGIPLSQQVSGMHGMTSESSSAETGRSGVLAPEFSRWLMGFPEAWDRASPGYEAWRRMQDAIESEG